jgi:hypothetical protein
MTSTHIPCERVTAWAVDCLEAFGVPHEDAEIVAASLTDMNNWSTRLGVAPLSAPLSAPAAA